MAAYLDLARRAHAEIVTPVAAESWPSSKASRATFETLLRPLEDAVRAGCDAVMLDLHGAMVIEDCDDAEGEIVRRLRAIAPHVPIAVTLDYHTNLSATLVDNATVITGYKTYPHVDMYEAGKLAGGILVGALDGAVEPVMAWGWKPLHRVGHAPRAGRRAVRRHPRVRAAHGGRRHRARRHAAAVVSACGHAVHRRVRDRRRRRALWRPRACARGLHAHAEDGVGPPRRIRVSCAAARRIGRGRQGVRSRQSGRAGAADRPLRQLRLGRHAGRDDRRRRNPEAGTGRRRDRADPRPGRRGDDGRRRRGPDGAPRPGRQDRHAVDRAARRAARGGRPRAGDHRRRVRDHRPHVHRRSGRTSDAPPFSRWGHGRRMCRSS